MLQSAARTFDPCAFSSVLWTVTRVMVLGIVDTGRFVVLTLGSYVTYMLTVEALLNPRIFVRE